MNLNFNLKSITALASRFHTLLVVVAAIVICGYTAYQISLVVAITPDPATIVAAEQTTKATSVKFDNKTISSITHQNTVSVSPNLNNIGTSNPFFGQ